MHLTIAVMAAITFADIIAYLERTWLTLEVILGIGLMIFIHELGHFIAAKKAGVRVETFSLGFGPVLYGFMKGDTHYRISLIPLGGYVKMAGENPGEDLSGAPDELPSKTPFQKMMIFSAGVLMNFLFAFITFPVIFATGVPFVSPEVGRVVPGGPAWKAGILEGDKFLEINGNTIYEFHDIPLNIALAKSGTSRILLERNGEKIEREVLPEKDGEAGRYKISISSPTRYEVILERGGAAEKAGMIDGDRVVAINGVAPDEWFDEPPDSGEPIFFEVVRISDGKEERLSFNIEPEWKEVKKMRRIGVRVPLNKVRALRGALARPREIFRESLQVGDVILSIGEKKIFRQNELIEALEKEPLVFQVSRSGKTIPIEYEEKWRPILINDLAMEHNFESSFSAVDSGSALGDLGLRDGVTILSVDGVETSSFKDLSKIFRSSEKKEHLLTLSRSGSEKKESIHIASRPYMTMDLGIDFRPYLLTRKLSVFEAMKAGFICAIYQVKACYLTLSRIISGDVAGKNLGGIITISVASYSFAQLGIARLFFFLAILSINLGFINILPIPVLDGGHLLFLLIEKIKGSPLNEKVVGYAQIAGLVLLLALLVYVTYNDFLRLFS